MTAVEKGIKALFAALNIDVEEVKRDTLERVAAFERNVTLVRDTLIYLHQRQERLEAMVEYMLSLTGVNAAEKFPKPSPPNAKEETNERSAAASAASAYDSGRTERVTAGNIPAKPSAA
jgi:hypothetical protein